jgi:CshA-type fibril repeat protein
LTIAGQGAYTVNGDGTVTFVPLSTFSGVATPVTYQVSDSLGQVATASIAVTVRTPPDAADDISSGLYDTNQTISPLDNDEDGSGTLSAASIKLCAAGTTAPNCTLTELTVAGEGTYTVNTTTGVVTFDPLPTFTGGATPVGYQVNDEFDQTTGATITPTVGLPPAPSANPDADEDDYDTNQVYSPLANDSAGNSSFPLDATSVKLCAAGETSPNCTLTSLTIAGEGTYTVNTTTGAVTFDPLPTFAGIATPISYQVKDSLNRAVSSTITATVIAPPLTMVNDTSTGNYDINQTITPLANDMPGAEWDVTSVKLCDPSSSPPQTSPNCTLTSLTIAGQGTYTVNPDGTVTFNPLPTFTGVATAITYQATDLLNRTASATITTEVGLPPAPTASPDTSSGLYDANQTISPLTNDAGGNSHFPLDVTTVKLCDPSTTPPQTSPNCTLTSLTVADEGTYTVNTTTGVVTFDPLPSFAGPATPISYQVEDILDRAVTSTISVTVGMPPAPSASPDADEDDYDTNQVYAPLANDSGGNSYFPLDASTVKLCSASQDVPNCTATTLTVADEGTYTVNSTTGEVTFNPLPSFTGEATPITYQAKDSLDRVVTSTITPTVGLPPEPTASPDTSSGSYDINQTISPLNDDAGGNSYFPLDATSVKLCGSGETSPNCTRTSLTIAGQGTYTVNADGTVTFDPLPTFSGTATPITYQVEDSLDRVVSSTITVTVVAPPLTMVNDTSTGAYDTNQTITPLTNDVPADNVTGADWKVATVKLCNPSTSPPQTSPNCTLTSLTIDDEGTYTVNPDGTVTFDPLPSFDGVATAITYQATDVLNRTTSATITVTVLAPPPPLASPDTVSLVAGGTETFSNIFGTDGLARKQTGGPELVPATVCIIDPATNVCDTDNQVVIADQGTFTLDPATGIVTYQSLSTATSGAKTAVLYSITDTLGVSATATLTPTIYPKPTALPDSSVGVMGVAQTLSPFGNDSPGTASHPLVRSSIKLCGDTETSPNCTQTSVTVDGEGTYTVKADGTVQFAPVPTFVGAATPLAYTVTDALGQKATSTLNPRVVPPPAPITQVDTGTAVVGSTVVLSPWVNDDPGAVPAGVEGEVELVPTSIRLCSPTDTAPNCTLTTLTTDDGTYTVDVTTGKVTFVHREDFLGTVTQPVTYVIENDWTGESGIGVATGLLIPTIVDPPPPPAPVVTVEIPLPSATDDSITSSWNTAQTYTPTTNDTFPTSHADHATLRLCAGGESPNICSHTTVTVPNEGTYTVNDDGTVTFAPVASFFGTATPLTYQVTDALGRFVHANLIPIVLAPEVGARVFDQATSTKPRTAQWLEPMQRGIPSPGAVFVDSTLQLYDTTTAVWAKTVVTPDGTWRVKAGRVKFTPVDGFTGMTQLQYSVSDSSGILLSAYLTVVVDEKEAMPATGSTPLPLAALALALVVLGLGLSPLSRGRRLRL